MRTHARIALLGTLLVATPAAAQICAGTASFAAGAARGGASASATKDVKSYGAAFALGQRVGPFGSVELARNEYDPSGNSTSLAVSAGYAIEAQANKKVQFCPHLTFGHEFMEDAETPLGTIESSANMFGLGATVGATTALTPTADFVPFASAHYVTVRAKQSVGNSSATFSDDYLALGVGAGFVLNRTVTIQPAVTVPLGLEGGNALFTIAFALNFGSAAR
jgi:hypothetical protein